MTYHAGGWDDEEDDDERNQAEGGAASLPSLSLVGGRKDGQPALHCIAFGRRGGRAGWNRLLLVPSGVHSPTTRSCTAFTVPCP